MSRPGILTMVVWSEPDGMDVAEVHVGRSQLQARDRNAVEMAMARDLVALGRPDQPFRTVGKDGRERLIGKSLHRVAMQTVTAGMRFAEWRSPSRDAAGNISWRTCETCGEAGYLHRDVCICCKTLAAFGGKTPSQRKAMRDAAKKQVKEPVGGSSTATEAPSGTTSSQAA